MIIRGAIAAMLAAFVTCSSPELSSLAIKYCVPILCAVYVIDKVLMELTIADQTSLNQQAYVFNPLCIIFLAEAISGTVSMILYAIKALTVDTAKKSFSFWPEECKLADLMWLAMPALMFTMNRFLGYVVIGQIDLATVGIFANIQIIWTAALWRFVFQAPLGWGRLAGILVILTGLIGNRMGLSMDITNHVSLALLWVLPMTLTSTLSSVAAEYAMKANVGLDINLQTAMLNMLGVIFSLSLLVATEPQRLLVGEFFRGFTTHTFFTVGLQAFACILAPRILKFSNAVTKVVASCLHMPLVVISATYLGLAPASERMGISASVVTMGCCMYLLQGTLEVSPVKQAKPHCPVKLQGKNSIEWAAQQIQ